MFCFGLLLLHPTLRNSGSLVVWKFFPRNYPEFSFLFLVVILFSHLGGQGASMVFEGGAWVTPVLNVREDSLP